MVMKLIQRYYWEPKLNSGLKSGRSDKMEKKAKGRRNRKVDEQEKNNIMKFTWNILSGTTICWNFISLRGEMRFFQHSKHTQPRFQYWIMIKKFQNGVSIGLFRHLPRVENTLTRLRLVDRFFSIPSVRVPK